MKYRMGLQWRIDQYIEREENGSIYSGYPFHRARVP
jgi:hypothetical protein